MSERGCWWGRKRWVWARVTTDRKLKVVFRGPRGPNEIIWHLCFCSLLLLDQSLTPEVGVGVVAVWREGGTPVGVTVSCALSSHLATPSTFLSNLPSFLQQSSHTVAVRFILWARFTPSWWHGIDTVTISRKGRRLHLMFLFGDRVNQHELCHFKVQKGSSQPPTARTSKVGPCEEEKVWSSWSVVEAQLQRVGGENKGRVNGLCLPQLQKWQKWWGGRWEAEREEGTALFWFCQPWSRKVSPALHIN